MAYIFLVIGVIITATFIVKRSSKVTLNIAFLKAVASVFFIITGLFSMVENSGCSRGVGALVAIGAVWGLLGDIALDLKYVFKKYSDEYLKAGFSSFGIGHIFYIGAMTLAFSSGGKSFIFAAVGVVLAALFVFATEPLFKVKYGKFKVITVAYTSLLGGTLGLAIGYTFFDFSVASLLMAIGFTLFLGSDVFLSGLYFGQTEKDRTNIVAIKINHILYYAAQFIIAISLLFIER